MHAFARLYADLDASTATLDKLAALGRYFAQAGDADAAWAVYLLAGGKPRQAVPSAVMRAAATQAAGIDDWLFEASYQAVGDLAETIALILPSDASGGTGGDADGPSDPGIAAVPLAEWMGDRLPALRTLDAQAQSAQLRAWWRGLDLAGRFVLVKLIGGGWRVGVSKLLVQRAVAAHAGLPPTLVAQRMMGYTDARRRPDAASWQALVAPSASGGSGDDPNAGLQGGAPYPFCLAHPTERSPDAADAPLGPVGDWQAEWKYDGVRAQIVRREGRCWIWTRGEELVTERFPEVHAAVLALPDGCVLDGELLVWDGDRPAPFARLQQRLNRKTVDRTLLAQLPVGFVAYDLLESEGLDRRGEPLRQRRERLERLATVNWPADWRVSPLLATASWTELAGQRADSRSRGVEGLMLKHQDSAYGVGRQRGGEGRAAWWKWKVEPMTLDAVLLYAQAGHGRRANLYTDYTFAVWNRRPTDAAEAQAVVEAIARREPAEPGRLTLVTLAKAYSGLNDAEFVRVDREVRANTLEKFGPVRSLRPTLVFELAFEGIGASARHKSGLALRFPRMLRIRDDKPLHEADDLASLRRWLPGG